MRIFVLPTIVCPTVSPTRAAVPLCPQASQIPCNFLAALPRWQRRSRRQATLIFPRGRACCRRNWMREPARSWLPAQPVKRRRCWMMNTTHCCAARWRSAPGGCRCWPVPGSPIPPKRYASISVWRHLGRMLPWWWCRRMCGPVRRGWWRIFAQWPTKVGCRCCCTTSPGVPAVTWPRKPPASCRYIPISSASKKRGPMPSVWKPCCRCGGTALLCSAGMTPPPCVRCWQGPMVWCQWPPTWCRPVLRGCAHWRRPATPLAHARWMTV